MFRLVGKLHAAKQRWSHARCQIRARNAAAFHRALATFRDEKSRALKFSQERFFALTVVRIYSRRCQNAVEERARRSASIFPRVCRAVKIVFGALRGRGIENQGVNVDGAKACGELETFDAEAQMLRRGNNAATVAANFPIDKVHSTRITRGRRAGKRPVAGNEPV